MGPRGDAHLGRHYSIAYANNGFAGGTEFWHPTRTRAMRVAVCRPQVPFVRGGAEIFTDTLVEELRVRGHQAEIVGLPWMTWPNDRLVTSALMWRLVELGPDLELPPDVVIATKFPSYLIKHPNKVVWLVHQLRAAYELDGTDLGQFSNSADDRAIVRGIHELDRSSLGEARKLFATSQNVADRLHRSTGLTAEVLPHPPQTLPYRCDGYGGFVLSVGRLDKSKRVDLLLEAAALEPALEVVVVGEGPERPRLEELAGEGVRFVGRVSEQELADLYARCRAVFYAPIDEDFGMVPYEAFQAAKPVVTTSDAGGPLELVRDGETGRVVEPDPPSVAAVLRELLFDETTARALGTAGQRAGATVTWDNAIAKLLG
jgi:glycosyltransferase involved in cell wall biosynthesis